jgi:hypothetical protein
MLRNFELDIITLRYSILTRSACDNGVVTARNNIHE